VYVKELHARYRLRRVRGVHRPGDALPTPRDAAAILIRLLEREVVEVSGLLCLSTKHHLLAYHELARGTVDGTPMHPREIFKAALLCNAPVIILAHNHPSGDVTPSRDDVDLTTRIAQAGHLMGIELLDHIIVSTEGRYYSFREAGRV
jgi:DNA repair protein RadC